MGSFDEANKEINSLHDDIEEFEKNNRRDLKARWLYVHGLIKEQEHHLDPRKFRKINIHAAY